MGGESTEAWRIVLDDLKVTTLDRPSPFGFAWIKHGRGLPLTLASVAGRGIAAHELPSM
jgi:hypothetical protein